MSTPTTISEGRYTLLRFNAEVNASDIAVDMKAENGSESYVNPAQRKQLKFVIHNITAKPKSVSFDGRKVKYAYDRATSRLTISVNWDITSPARILIHR